jgi:hypothetical protein
MKIIITESQYKHLIENSELDDRIVKNITNLVDYILSEIKTRDDYARSEMVDFHDYDTNQIVVGHGNDVLTFEFDHELEEEPYFIPATHEDPAEGSNGYWNLKSSNLKYEKLFDDEFITVYDGKDFTKFMRDIPNWLNDEIQDQLRERYEDGY